MECIAAPWPLYPLYGHQHLLWDTPLEREGQIFNELWPTSNRRVAHTTVVRLALTLPTKAGSFKGYES